MFKLFVLLKKDEGAANILVTRDSLETAFHQSMEFPFSSTVFKYFLTAPIVSDYIAGYCNRSEATPAVALGTFMGFEMIFHLGCLQLLKSF